MTAFTVRLMPDKVVLCRPRFGFQRFHHLVGGGDGSVLFEAVGNHKDGVLSLVWNSVVLAVNIGIEEQNVKKEVDRDLEAFGKLEQIFDQAGIETLEIEMGMLVRRKKADGYEWLI